MIGATDDGGVSLRPDATQGSPAEVFRGEAALVAGRLRFPISRRGGVTALALFAAIFALPQVLAGAHGFQRIRLFVAFYRSGALVFGGGHVVLPLLQAEVVAPGWVTNEAFLSGYGLAQAAPGPLFAFAPYLGAVMAPPPNGLAAAAIALVAIFLPDLLLVYGMLPFWDGLRSRPVAQAAMRGANAAVVGILALALYDPIWTNGVRTPRDFALAAGGFLLVDGLEGSVVGRGRLAGRCRNAVCRDACLLMWANFDNCRNTA